LLPYQLHRLTGKPVWALAAPELFVGAFGRYLEQLGAVSTKNPDRDRLMVKTLLTGFGASAHLVLKMVRHQLPDVQIYVFARSPGERDFALSLGAVWAGDTRETPPHLLDRIIDTTPAWAPVVAGLKNLAPGGRLVINAIRKESADQDALLKMNYATHLWHEKEIKSVANVARSDVAEFLELAARIPIVPEIETFGLAEANRALMELKNRKIRGAKVLVMAPD
jgi:propanol-preferring alcohol dehydrogenase